MRRSLGNTRACGLACSTSGATSEAFRICMHIWVKLKAPTGKLLGPFSLYYKIQSLQRLKNLDSSSDSTELYSEVQSLNNSRAIECHMEIYRSRSRCSDDRARPRSAMAELTPNVLDVITNRIGNLRDMAHRVNFNVTAWYSTVWQFSANIVAMDFIRGSGIVETAIEANENRHLHCRY